MRTLFILSVFSLLWVSCNQNQATEDHYRIMGDLSLGSYQVGYRTIFHYDITKTGIPYSDWDGNLYFNYDAAQGRQYQINVWYPAKSGSGTPINYDHYVNLLGRQIDFNDTEAQSEFARQMFIQQTNDLGGNGSFTSDDLDTLLALKVTARLEAQPLPGPFPVVLFPNGGSPAFQSIMCEFLASHGYVVIAFAAKGRFSFGLEVSTIGIETAVDDLEFVLDKIGTLPFTDMHQIGLMANAISSSVCAAAASRNEKIKALVSLEGGLPSAFEQRLLKKSVFYTPENLHLPILLIYAPHPSIDPKYTFHLKYADRYYAHFPKMSEFVMLNFGMFDSVIPDIIGAHEGNTQLGYETANQLILNFLDIELKGKNGDVLDGTAMTAYQHSVDTFFVLKGLTPPPNLAILKDLFIKKGFQPIDSIYQTLKSDQNPQPFDRSFYDSYRAWLAWEKDSSYQNRRHLYQLALDSYPQSSRVNYYYAYYLWRTGQKDEAIIHYNKALALLPTDDDPNLDMQTRERIKEYCEQDLKELNE